MGGGPMSRERVLLVHDDPRDEPVSSFIVSDAEALRQAYELETMTVQGHWARAAYLGVLLNPRAWGRVRRARCVVCWFGSCAPVVLMARLLGRPVAVICGGADVVHVPEIGYGLDPRGFCRFLLFCLGYHLASRVLLFSRSSMHDFLALPGMEGSRCAVLYLGIDAGRFPLGEDKRPVVLTVGMISHSSLRRKGIDTMVAAARLAPELQFRIGGMVVSGAARDELLGRIPANVAFLGELTPAQLVDELRTAKVYAQLSYHEGFGMALVEAMACGCRPVVTDRGSIPEVAGDQGLVVPVADPAAAAAAFRAAIAEDDAGRPALIRQRVVDLFSASGRDQGIRAEVAGLIAGRRTEQPAGEDHCRVVCRDGVATVPEAFEEQRHRFPYAELLRREPRPADVLEVGCGSGYGAHLLAGAGHRVIAVDPSPEAVGYAASRYPGVDFRTGTGTALPFPDASFDVLASFQVIEHVEQEADFLREARRVLRPGGRLYLTTPNRRLRLRPFQRPWNPYHVREHSARSLRRSVAAVFPAVEIAGIVASDDLMALERRRLQGRLSGWIGFLVAVASASLRARLRLPVSGQRRTTVEGRDFSLSAKVGDCLDLLALARR